jgi:thiopurine S-methyltransferase
LAGKTVDLRWLRERGHPVVAVELSEDAALAFYAEAGLQPVRSQRGRFTHLEAGGIEYFVGDIFELENSTLGPFAGLWDRGALVALPAELRLRYVAQIRALSPPDTRSLLLALEYAQDRMKGPPFSVPEAEVAALFGASHHITLLVREDILAQEPRFQARGLTALASCTYLLCARA